MKDWSSKLEDGESAGTWRLFVAISPPDEVKEEIEKVQREMRKELPGNFMRWTKREQFHLTLKFLGNVAEARVAELSEALREACQPFKALRLRAQGVGIFPDMGFPRVVWVGVRDAGGLLARLQNALEINTVPFAENKNGPSGPWRSQAEFIGHVTLARIQGIRRQQVEILSRLAAGMAGRSLGEWMADKVELIRSELSSAGSHYTTVAEFPLLGN
jgi:RNA 2',3'-cyclic 3'-phosphodiesterase